MRHAHGVFLGSHNREAEILHSEALSGKYVPVPVWFSKYDIPYGFLPETPWYLTYRGLEISGPFAKRGGCLVECNHFRIGT